MGSISWGLHETQAMSGWLAYCEAVIPSLLHPFLSTLAASLGDYKLLISIVDSHFKTCLDGLRACEAQHRDRRLHGCTALPACDQAHAAGNCRIP